MLTFVPRAMLCKPAPVEVRDVVKLNGVDLSIRFFLIFYRLKTRLSPNW